MTHHPDTDQPRAAIETHNIASDRRIPALKPGLRYTLDRDWGIWLLHTTESTLLPPPPFASILLLMDGERDIAGIIAQRAETSGLPTADIVGEVQACLADLEQRHIVAYRHAGAGP